MGKCIYSIAAIVCLVAMTTALPPLPTPACYSKQLSSDQSYDLSFVCNDGRQYPEQEIEEALYYADDHWRIYLNLTSTCFQDQDTYFLNKHSEPNYYKLKSVCNTTRTMVHTIYAMDGQVCHVVRPMSQKVFYATCGGECNLGYDGVTGYHCIQRGITYRNFLGYCRLPDSATFPESSPIYALDPSVDNFYDPRVAPPTHRMQHTPLKSGGHYKPKGYFTELSVTLPSYCGCRGYFCPHDRIL
ncbi:uncharacterized protein LOC124141447 [Haliotis rufescens]|uniref:uncharacterized protein LOC124141447 n=1 Tax=Haliotis rufescens TaxID=6454 RepID=UPI00201EF83A|nr:uncharacterized protein LOC124141447 [Haliotis rufescens]